jgi:cytidine deaminase
MDGPNRLAIRSKDKLHPGKLEICRKALELAKAAFAPISGFAVGVIIRTPDGQEFAGQNQENSALDSIHAEMAALTNWNAAGEPKIEKIAVVGFRFWPAYDASAVVTPCGRCRQWLYEAAIRSQSNPEIICGNGDLSEIKTFRIEELLPQAFLTDEKSALYKNWYGELRPKLRNF